MLVGTPEEVVERLRTIREWFGDITISLQVISGNPTHEESARSIAALRRAGHPALPRHLAHRRLRRPASR
ncbi:hypothetical protein GCM10017690_33460 [Microbacterium terregens]